MKKADIKSLLAFYKCPCDISGIQESDNFIDFYLIPEYGTTINKLKARQADFSLSIGQAASIEVENNHLILRIRKEGKTSYNYFEYLCNLDKKSGQLAIGINPHGEYIQSNLYNMPHLLISGQTGSGKSVFLHNCIVSLMINNNVCLRLIDLKRVELSIYNGINKLVSDCITDYQEAEKILRYEVQEMQARYTLMEKYKVNHFSMLPEKRRLLPRVIIIDELADLMLNKETRKSVENSIVRIAQLGRAAGIHLILATQRPDRNVITGLIKANIPCKIAFTVANRYDASVIGIQGAERLTGKGDALFLESGKEVKRIQSFFISPEDLHRLILEVKKKQKPKKKTLSGFFKRLL